ncbi:hypothetical protein [Candidatus Phytoplasma meliae]|nr:hypothetical protein [Candidatus Phytoplasma meliae]
MLATPSLLAKSMGGGNLKIFNDVTDDHGEDLGAATLKTPP